MPKPLPPPGIDISVADDKASTRARTSRWVKWGTPGLVVILAFGLYAWMAGKETQRPQLPNQAKIDQAVQTVNESCLSAIQLKLPVDANGRPVLSKPKLGATVTVDTKAQSTVAILDQLSRPADDAMLTNEQADLTYHKALMALNATIRSGDGVTEAQKALAKEKRDDLILNYVGQAIARIEERTAKFEEFIGEMEAVIAEFDPSTTIAGILQLKEVVGAAVRAGRVRGYQLWRLRALGRLIDFTTGQVIGPA